MRKFIYMGLVGLLLLVFAACGTAAPPASGPTATKAPTSTSPAGTSTGSTSTPSSSSSSEGTKLVTQDQHFQFQYTHITRTVDTFPLLQEFADRVRERTEGQVDIQITSFPELGISGPDTLRLLQDGTLSAVEVEPNYVGGELPAVEMTRMYGLSPTREAQLEVLEVTEPDIARLIEERTGAKLLFRTTYPAQYFFSDKPLRTAADFQGLKIRQYGTSLADLIAGLGGEGQFIAFAEVYTALERGIIGAGITAINAAYGQKWYEVTDYLVGPIPSSLASNYVTISKVTWERLPEDLQQIIIEEGNRIEEKNLRLVGEWEEESIQLNQDAGMEYIPFSDELLKTARQAVTERMLPNWVARTGGPDSEAVQIFNDKVAPIVGVKINPDGTAVETEVAGQETQLVTRGKSFQFQLTCVNRTLKPCGMLAEYASRVRERTEGQVDIQITSYPELGLSGPDTLRLLKDGTVPFVEMYPGYVGGEWPFVEMAELIGMFPDEQTQRKVIDALKDEEERIIRERFNGKVVARHMYDNQFIFSKRPIRSPADFRGLQTRTHSTASGDFVNSLGGEGQFIAFAEAYTALERGILEAAMASGTAGIGQKWFEVTRYLIGPIVSRPHNSVIMNLDEWNRLPQDIQQIMLEEGRKHTEENSRLVREWDQEAIDDAIAQGMEYIEFTPEMKEAIRQGVINQILPNWVQRAGGPSSEPVRIFNEQVAPIVGIEVLPDGTAREMPKSQ